MYPWQKIGRGGGGGAFLSIIFGVISLVVGLNKNTKQGNNLQIASNKWDGLVFFNYYNNKKVLEKITKFVLHNPEKVLTNSSLLYFSRNFEFVTKK